jgi:hypothetical protein
MSISYCFVNKPIKSFSEQVTSSDRMKRLKRQTLYYNYNLVNPPTNSNPIPPNNLNIGSYSNSYEELYDLLRGYIECNKSSSWYYFSIVLNESNIFNGIFSINNITNEVTSFYETFGSYTNFDNNILGPKKCCTFDETDNKFYPALNKFGILGVNLTKFSYYGNDSAYYNLALNNQVQKCDGSKINVTMSFIIIK